MKLHTAPKIFKRISLIICGILPKLYNPTQNISIAEIEGTRRDIINEAARKNLFAMLSAAGLIPYYTSEFSRYGKEKDFFEFLIALFLSDLETVIGTHFYHEYVYQSEDRVHLKGKLDYQRQIVKLPSELHKFSCIFDEFSIDIGLTHLVPTERSKN